jgi:hypothetical protein
MKHKKVLEAIFKRPTQAGIPWIDIEALLINLGASISEEEVHGFGLNSMEKMRFFIARTRKKRQTKVR